MNEALERLMNNGFATGEKAFSFAWQVPGSSGQITFTIDESIPTDDGWTIRGKDGNGKPFESSGKYQYEAMCHAVANWLSPDN